ncbi:hypothetical protein Glove_718g5 [Diversispora epigaea]|uniref:Uncharacterized protein n=1 Tax=Diversispora epigaea TaxID=1348612 RepID=A0A397G5E8_9GLOM|nr:hypothetical protein Glove_718g5 [Diversispora epigaea]
MSEKLLYSKVCIAESINFVIDEASHEVTDMKENDKFSCNLATILTRDREVVAVRLKISSDSCKVFLSKNSDWLEKDVVYINKIENYLKNISKYAPVRSIDAKALTNEILAYCSVKLEYRFEKLKKDIIGGWRKNHDYIVSFMNFASINVDNIDEVDRHKICGFCCNYYKKTKDDTEIPQKFLRHLKKVGSYISSVAGIIACARNKNYKPLFSKIELHRMDPIVIMDQPIFSWENIIKRFINDEEYDCFMNKCSKNTFAMGIIKKIYTDKTTQKLQLDRNDIKQHIYLHAEMNILTSIINHEEKNRVFIAVSKKCCYLCELYINFARNQGYNIIISGIHKKIYHGWKLPHVADTNFRTKSLEYIMENLDRIIENKIKRYTSSLLVTSDSSAESVDSKNQNELEEVLEYVGYQE